MNTDIKEKDWMNNITLNGAEKNILADHTLDGGVHSHNYEEELEIELLFLSNVANQTLDDDTVKASADVLDAPDNSYTNLNTNFANMEFDLNGDTEKNNMQNQTLDSSENKIDYIAKTNADILDVMDSTNTNLCTNFANAVLLLLLFLLLLLGLLLELVCLPLLLPLLSKTNLDHTTEKDKMHDNTETNSDDEEHELEEDEKLAEREKNAAEMNNTMNQTLDSIYDHKLNETNLDETTKDEDIMENKLDDIAKANLDETDATDNTNTNSNTNFLNMGIDKKGEMTNTNSRMNGRKKKQRKRKGKEQTFQKHTSEEDGLDTNLDDEKHELEEDAKAVERAENTVEMNNTTHQTLDNICDHKLNETNSNEQTKNKDIMENKFDDIVKANLDVTDGLDNTNTNSNTNLANTGIDKK
jgi:hypothetical protein